MTQPTLDALDRKILDVLQADGRASNVDLSARVHLSAPQCFRRVRSLEERGVIRSYRAEVLPESLGLGVMAYVSLNIDGGQFGRVREIEASIRDFPQILECHTVSGDYDYLLKVVARDLPSGHVLSADDIVMKSPGGGIPPYELDNVLGMVTTRALHEDDFLSFEVLGEPEGAELARS